MLFLLEEVLLKNVLTLKMTTHIQKKINPSDHLSTKTFQIYYKFLKNGPIGPLNYLRTQSDESIP